MRATFLDFQSVILISISNQPINVGNNIIKSENKEAIDKTAISKGHTTNYVSAVRGK